METIILTINEACHQSRTGRTALYAAIKSGQLSARKRGSRTMILANDLKQWVETVPQNGIERIVKKKALTEVRTFRQSGLLSPTTWK